jgi:hypothetical protein
VDEKLVVIFEYERLKVLGLRGKATKIDKNKKT